MIIENDPQPQFAHVVIARTDSFVEDVTDDVETIFGSFGAWPEGWEDYLPAPVVSSIYRIGVALGREGYTEKLQQHLDELRQRQERLERYQREAEGRRRKAEELRERRREEAPIVMDYLYNQMIALGERHSAKVAAHNGGVE